MSEYFNEKAGDWDANEMVRKLASDVGSAILDRVPLRGSMDVMDFGAGTGLISSQLAPLVHRVVAVDTAEAMLKEIVGKLHLRGKVEVVCQDILEYPLDEQFDLVVSAMAMHHVEDTDKLIRTFARHLKPGARVALADLDQEDGSFHPSEAAGVFHHGFDRRELKAILERRGFREVRFVTAHTVVKGDREYPVFLLTARAADGDRETRQNVTDDSGNN